MARSRRRTKLDVPVTALAVLALVVTSCSPQEVAPTTTVTPQPGTTAGVDDAIHPDVPPIDCGPLITLDEIDIAFDKVGESPDVVLREGGEACTHTLAADEDFFIRIEPGHPDDFEPGAMIEGQTGVSVEGVGDEALWFGADGRTVSVISVRARSTFGALHFRMVLSRPEADAATHRDTVRMLALAALPRFPGVKPEPMVFEFTSEPADLSGSGYLENLLAREADGEWSRGEGLVATLRYLAGEIGAAGVLRTEELADTDTTRLTVLAHEYLSQGGDPSMAGEIRRLLEELTPSTDALRRMVEGAPAAGAVLASYGGGRLAQNEDLCVKYFGVSGPCMVDLAPPALKSKWPERYKEPRDPDVMAGWLVHRPFASVAGDWTVPWIDSMVQGLSDSVMKYQEVVDMPPIDVYLLNGTQKVPVGGTASPCVVLVGPAIRTMSMAHAQQALASKIAYCLEASGYETVTAWWSVGLASYLGGYVYPEANLEHRGLPGQLRAMEQAYYNLESRGAAAWIFFEYLHELIGASGNIGLFADPEAGLRTIIGNWHGFNERLTDTTIRDLDPGSGDVPYNPPFEDVQITGPMILPPDPDPIGAARAQVVVPAGQKACITYDGTGDVKGSWRTGVPGKTGGAWSTDLPEELTDVATFLVTTAPGDGQLTITVEKLIPELEDCDAGDIDLDDPSDCLTELCGPSDYFYREPGN